MRRWRHWTAASCRPAGYRSRSRQAATLTPAFTPPQSTGSLTLDALDEAAAQGQHRLRTLSELGVVRIAGGSEVLLPRDVPRHVEQQGTHQITHCDGEFLTQEPG